MQALLQKYDVQYPESTQDRLIWAGKVGVVAAVAAGLAIALFYSFGALPAAYASAVSAIETGSGHVVLTRCFKAGAILGASVGCGAALSQTPEHAKECTMFKVTGTEKSDVINFLYKQAVTTLFATVVFGGIGGYLFCNYGFFAKLLNIGK